MLDTIAGWLRARRRKADGSRSAIMQSSGLTDPADWFVVSLGAGESDSGVDVNGATILTSGPVWQAVTVIAGDIGRLPLEVLQSAGEIAINHPASVLLGRRPNAKQRAITFKETMQAWALLWGNAVAAIERSQDGRPMGLLPMPPTKITPVYVGDFLARINYRADNGRVTSLDIDDVLHIPGLVDGTWGASVVTLARNTVGHNLALQKHGNRQFKNNARPSGILEKDGPMSREARTNLRREWNEIHQGLDNVARIALLQEGVKFKPMQISNEDAQWLEARRFSREEVAAWFNLPPHKLGAMENASVRSNLEEQNRDYWNTTLSRWARKWEEECEAKLLRGAGQNRFQVRFRLGDLLRGDIVKRYGAYAQARQWGWLSVNEIRQQEGMPPIGPEGDAYLSPLNMVDISAADATSTGDGDAPTDGRMAVSYRHLLDSRLHELFQIETERILAILKNRRKRPDGYVRRFCEGFSQVLVEKTAPIFDVLDKAGLLRANDPDAVLRQYAKQSLKRVEAVMAQTDTAAWHDQVGLEIETWGERRQTLLAELMEVDDHVPV